MKHEVQVLDELHDLQIGLHVLQVEVPSSYRPVGQSQFWVINLTVGVLHVLHTPLREHV